MLDNERTTSVMNDLKVLPCRSPYSDLPTSTGSGTIIMGLKDLRGRRMDFNAPCCATEPRLHSPSEDAVESRHQVV